MSVDIELQEISKLPIPPIPPPVGWHIRKWPNDNNIPVNLRGNEYVVDSNGIIYTDTIENISRKLNWTIDNNMYAESKPLPKIILPDDYKIEFIFNDANEIVNVLLNQKTNTFIPLINANYQYSPNKDVLYYTNPTDDKIQADSINAAQLKIDKSKRDQDPEFFNLVDSLKSRIVGVGSQPAVGAVAPSRSVSAPQPAANPSIPAQVAAPVAVSRSVAPAPVASQVAAPQVATGVAPGAAAGGSNTPTLADKFGAGVMALITGTVTACAVPLLLLGGKKTKKTKKNKRGMKGGNYRNSINDRTSDAKGIESSGLNLLKSKARPRHLKRTMTRERMTRGRIMNLERMSRRISKRKHTLKGGLKNKIMNKLINKLTGGKVLDSGGFGCVFKPALKCKNKSRPLGKISKLMASGDTDDEFYEISKYEPILKKIPNYRNYFIIDDITICDPDKLTKEDLDNFGKCTAFKKYDLTPANINENLKYLAMLNEPDGGPELDEYVKSNFTNYSKLIAVNNSLIGLLEHGIIPMNKLKIFHFDIKGSNILVSTNESAMHTRLIDWGLSKQLINNKDIMLDEISHRPFQFNLPYSIIIFNRKFIDAYEQFLSAKPRPATAAEIYTYTFNYLTELEKTDRGAHLRGVLRDFKMIFTGQFGMNTIAKYVADILVKYTKNNKLELHDYLSIFLHNVDIWGFAMAYLAFTDIISKKTHLDQTDRQIVECIRKVFTFLFQYNLSPISVPNLVNILRTMNSAFKPSSPNERKTVNLYVSKKNVQNSKSRLTNELKAEVKAK